MTMALNKWHAVCNIVQVAYIRSFYLEQLGAVEAALDAETRVLAIELQGESNVTPQQRRYDQLNVESLVV